MGGRLMESRTRVQFNGETPSHKLNIVFICSRNATLSQMAEGFVSHYAGHVFNVYSAGIIPSQIHPLTIAALEESGLDMYGKKAKTLDLLRAQLGSQTTFDVVISLYQGECAQPIEWPEAPYYLKWSFDDPADFDGTRAEQFGKFRQVRDQLAAQVKAWLVEEEIPLVCK